MAIACTNLVTHSALLSPSAVDDELHILLQRIALQDQNALAALHRRASKHLKQLALRLLKDHDLSEDVLQESFLQIWQNADQYRRAQGRPMTWMNTILRYRALDKLKAEQREQKRRDELECNLIGLGEDHAPCPTTELEREQLRHCCQRQLQSLPAHQQQAVTLAYFHDLSREEIARYQRQSVGTVKSRLHRGLAQLVMPD
ncbi:RNA polymerase sigma factor [Ketobacter sp.]|uniref:RNA polymerase sigma factor n=1 Tax=Ketobacter sp. TaxID=2083498 RepID=UPI000F122F99|nr:sigma-70 family RNA polymerase sigma factor [Ketobacter sp.]RLU01260.1 MAG: sigma-70 family RNA polymerase sigma factor [Ketobacter sp.]